MKLKIPDYLLSRFVPNIEAVNLIEYFLISAVFSFLGIRAFLTITGFPQVSGGDFHIAHILWGGILMALGLFIVFTYLGYTARIIAAIIGGIGFGAFVDELGKVITTDNNYFYEPTVALIYLIFVIIFLVIKLLQSKLRYSDKTYHINAFEYLSDILYQDFDESERQKVLSYLRTGKNPELFIKKIAGLIHERPFKPAKTSIFDKFIIKLKKISFKLIKSAKFQKLIIVYFIFSSITGFIFASFSFFLSEPKFSDYGYFTSVLAANTFAFIGIFYLIKKNKLAAYKMFIYSLLISIFISQFFLFISDQFLALITLMIHIIIYIVIEMALKKTEDENIPSR